LVFTVVDDIVYPYDDVSKKYLNKANKSVANMFDHSLCDDWPHVLEKSKKKKTK